MTHTKRPCFLGKNAISADKIFFSTAGKELRCWRGPVLSTRYDPCFDIAPFPVLAESTTCQWFLGFRQPGSVPARHNSQRGLLMMMISSVKNVAKVFVVDSHPDDYQGICQRATDDGLNLQLFNSGRDALRKDPAQAPELWVVNMRLPDMSGTDLLSMLRWRYPGVPVVLVSDSYRAEDEISARCSGAELYLSKPLQSEWLASTAAAQR